MATSKRAKINRRNAQKSTGPKTAEGKSRSRLNALKHGMTATLPVLPGEDPEALQGRIDAWTDDLKPRNEAERDLTQRAAQVSWQLDRIERAHVARLTANILNATDESQNHEKEEDAAALGERLFWDRRGPLQNYPTFGYRCDTDPRTSWSGVADDPDSPARLVIQLESTLAGCQWLLDQWAELRARLEPGQSWQSPDKLKAIRLLGKQPLAAADSTDVATVFIASHRIDPTHDSAFWELGSEMTEFEAKAYNNRLVNRKLESCCPGDQAQARALLLQMIERATGRLETKAEAHQRRAEIDAKSAPDRLAFDGSAEGERLRRYETSCNRTFFRTFDALVKMLKTGERLDFVVAATNDESVPVTAKAVDLDSQIDPASAVESTHMPVAETETTQAIDPDTQPSRQPVTTSENTILRNEASSTVPPSRQPVTTSENTVLRNEASSTVPPSRPQVTTNENLLLRNKPSSTVPPAYPVRLAG
jgi:hypothetical protein